MTEGLVGAGLMDCLVEAGLMFEYVAELNMRMSLERFLRRPLKKGQRLLKMLPRFSKITVPMKDTAQTVMRAGLTVPVLRGLPRNDSR